MGTKIFKISYYTVSRAFSFKKIKMLMILHATLNILPECRNCYSLDSRFPNFPGGEFPPELFNYRIHIENVI
jgi:hypothetical protein